MITKLVLGSVLSLGLFTGTIGHTVTKGHGASVVKPLGTCHGHYCNAEGCIVSC